MEKNSKKILYGILGLSVLLRIAAAVMFGDQVVNLPGTNDQISYHALALRVLGGHGFTFGETWWPITAAEAPTAHWSFLYTGYLVFVYAIFGPHPLVARLIQAVLVGILQPLLTYWLGKRFFNSTVGLVSAAISAIYIYFFYYAATLMTEPFYITAILAVLALSVTLMDRITAHKPGEGRREIFLNAALLGLVLGLTVLMRQVFMLFIPFLFLWMGWVLRKKGFWTLVGSGAIAGAIIVLMILPFSLFNYSRFGRFVLLNTNAGYAFYLANHPIYGTKFIPILPAEMGTYQDLIPVELRSLDEAALDTELMKAGLQFVVDDPGRYIQLSISRIPAFFMFWPSSGSGTVSNISRTASFGLFLPFMIYGVVLALVSRKHRLRLSSASMITILFFGFYAAIHLLSWSLVRYRLPIDAVMLIFAGLALVNLYEHALRLRPGKQRSTARKHAKHAAKHV